MKKIIISIIATVCIMTIGCAGIIGSITKKYEAKLEVAEHSGEYFDEFMINEYNELIDKYDEVNHKLSVLEANVWNMHNGEAYEVSVEHDGQTHTWQSDNKNIFSRETYIVSELKTE